MHFENAFQMRFDDLVIDFSSLFLAREKSAVLHQSQMFGRHGTWQITGFRQLTDRIVTLKQHLYHSQPMRVSQCAETFGCLS